MTIRPSFDDALPILVATLIEHGASDLLEKGVILRDITGRLSFFSPADESDHLASPLAEALGNYVRQDRSVVNASEPGSAQILLSEERIPIQVDGTFCNLIDRRIVGSGWLAVPNAATAVPARIVFASLKGGVGRSTALTVTAADLARRGRNILVIDLDLEAPGLGDLLLDDDSVPEFGVIDFLVENGIGGIGDEDTPSFIGTSRLTTPDGGRVDVMPALGTRSLRTPENILSKLSRAMIEDVSDDGSVSVGTQISSMIDAVSQNGGYDAILIDSRAGLAELAAPAVTGIGATVLLFGTAQKQTMAGYRALFSSLQLLAQRDRASGNGAEWRLSLRPVYAKASMKSETEERFRDDIFDLYSSHIYDEERSMDEINEPLRFTRNDNAAPHWPLVIPFNQGFLDFDPARSPGQLAFEYYEQTFRPFLNAIDEIISEASTPDQ